jgi:hypothetical protein
MTSLATSSLDRVLPDDEVAVTDHVGCPGSGVLDDRAFSFSASAMGPCPPGTARQDHGVVGGNVDVAQHQQCANSASMDAR